MSVNFGKDFKTRSLPEKIFIFTLYWTITLVINIVAVFIGVMVGSTVWVLLNG